MTDDILKVPKGVLKERDNSLYWTCNQRQLVFRGHDISRVVKEVLEKPGYTVLVTVLQCRVSVASVMSIYIHQVDKCICWDPVENWWRCILLLITVSVTKLGICTILHDSLSLILVNVLLDFALHIVWSTVLRKKLNLFLNCLIYVCIYTSLVLIL